jgi:hypothetical protein
VLSISALLFAAGYVLAQGDEAPLTPTGPTNSLDVARIGPDTYRLTMNGPDPWVVLEGAPEAFDHAEMHVIGFEYVCPEGLDSFAVYFGPPMGNHTVVSQGPVPPAADWTAFALDLSTVPTWRETIHEFRLDPGNDPEAVVLIRNVRLRGLTADEEQAKREAERIAEMELERVRAQVAEHLVAPANITMDGDEMAASHVRTSASGIAATAVVGRDLDLVTLVEEAMGEVPPSVELGPPIVAGQGDFAANQTVVRVFNRYGLAEAQFLAYPPEVTGGVQVEVAGGANGEPVIVATPIGDADVHTFRVFTPHGNLVREVPVEDIEPPFSIATGAFGPDGAEAVLVASRIGEGDDIPYAAYSLQGERLLAGALSVEEMAGPVTVTAVPGVGAQDDAVFTLPAAGMAARVDPRTGEATPLAVGIGRRSGGVYPLADGRSFAVTGADPDLSTLQRVDGAAVRSINVGARENVFWFTPSGMYGQAGEGRYTKHAEFQHLRLDFASPVVEDPDFSRTEPDYWAGEAMQPTIRGMLSAYDRPNPTCWEPCFTHRWFYGRARKWAEATDPETGLPAYVLVDRENRIGTYGEFGQTDAFVTGSYAPGVAPIESLYTYPQRAFLKGLVERFRQDPEHFVAVEPNHEMEINAESPDTHGDYNPNMIRGFYRYLVSLYGDLETVNALFGTEFTDQAFDAPRNLGRGEWDEYSSQNAYYMAWMRYMDYVIYRVVAGTYREALLAGFPPEAIKCHQIPDLYAISSLTAFSEPAQRVTPIDWMLNAGVGYGFTRYGVWYDDEHNVVQGAHSSGFDSVLVGEYQSLTPDSQQALAQLRYMRDHGIQFIHCMVWPEGHDQGFNAALTEALQALVAEDQPRPGVTGGTGQVRPVAIGEEAYDVVSLGTGEGRTGLIKSIREDGSWTGAVYLVPFRAHVAVTPLVQADAGTFAGQPLALGPLTQVAAGNLVEFSCMARGASGDEALELRLYHRGIELPQHRLRLPVTDEWKHVRMAVRIQVEMDEIALEIGPARGGEWLQGEVEFSDLVATRHTEMTTRLEHGVFAGERHRGGVTFDVFEVD